jgi:hypothetical protein
MNLFNTDFSLLSYDIIYWLVRPMLHLGNAKSTCGEEREGGGGSDSWDFLQKTTARDGNAVPFFPTNKCIIFRDQKESLTVY